MAKNSQVGNPIDGGTVVMVSQLLKRNILIISADNIWNCHDLATDIAFVFGGEDKFIPTEVSTSMFVSMFVVTLHLLVFISFNNNLIVSKVENLTTL